MDIHWLLKLYRAVRRIFLYNDAHLVQTPEQLAEVINKANPEAGVMPSDVLAALAYGTLVEDRFEFDVQIKYRSPRSHSRGSKVEHRFNVENVYEEEMQLQLVPPSCGCLTAKANRQVLKTWEKAEITVTVDTRQLGRKDATIGVIVVPPPSLPRQEVQLHTHVYIRSDIVVQPGSVLFGSVAQGAGAKQSVTVSYAGRDDWRIERVECANPMIEARAVETNRTPGQPAQPGQPGQLGTPATAAQIAYSLSVQLKPEARPGYIHDQLVLVTNDQNARAARIPVDIEGLVAAALSVSPPQLMMGLAEVDKLVSRNLVVQGRAPFRIVAVQSSDERFQCKPPAESKSAHVLPVTFLARPTDAVSGSVTAKLRIETDLPGAGPVEVSVSVRITPAPPAKP